MYQHLAPVSIEYNFQSAKEYGLLGGYLNVHTRDNKPELTDVKICIIGIPESRNAITNEDSKYAPQAIRKALYNLFPGKWHHRIADLGNIKLGAKPNETFERIISLLNKIPQNVKVIVIGGSQDITISLTNFYNLHNKPYNLSVFDSVIDGVVFDNNVDNENYLTQILTNNESCLENLSIVGVQSYYNHPEKYKVFEKLFVDSYKLGEVQKNVQEVEPEIREAQIISIDINSIKNSDVSAQEITRPNGFTGQEICTISRLSGLSIKNKIFGIFEFNPMFDKQNLGSGLVAQMIWYYIEGVNEAVTDYPAISKNELTKFYVSNEVVDLEFYQNKKTNRWWVSIPKISSNNELYSCSEQDYKEAVNMRISKRMFHIIQKITI